MNAITAYALAKGYTDDSILGISGSLAGKNCTIKSITPVATGNEVTFEWTADDGTVNTSVMIVKDGVKGDKGDKGDKGSKGDKGDPIACDTDFSATSVNALENKVITNAMGAANGFATLDSNGKLAWSQTPTSAMYIAGSVDAKNVHTLPDAQYYTDGAQLVVVSKGNVVQSTEFTLEAGETIEDYEVNQANTLIAAGFVFTIASGETTLGTVKSFAINKVVLSDDSEILLPYEADLNATSTPDSVQIQCESGDMFMLIYGHWQHLSNTSSVTSVNTKTGAVSLNATEIPYSGTQSTKAKIDEVAGKVTVQHYVTQAEYDAMSEAGTLVDEEDYNIYEE